MDSEKAMSIRTGASSETRIDVCPKHGEFENKINRIMGHEFKLGCQECAKETKAAEEKDRLEREALEERMRISRNLGMAAIPKRFVGKSFDGYRAETPKQQKNLKVCSDYADNFLDHYKAGRCLLMFGKPGTGKTHLAASIANQIINTTTASAVYRTIGGILVSIKATYDKFSEKSEGEVMAGLTDPHLLIIDEIGATKPSEFELATLFTIINSRYEQQKPTIIVTNLMPEELPAAMGERCVDRLREGGGIALIFDWESARKDVAA